MPSIDRSVSRFRLRFLLQEFDLPIGEVVIGRSPDCHITIEDPLISRQHAKIVVRDNGCVLIDLKSRNGSRLNGRPVEGPCELKDTDRIRIGAQELVFFEMSSERRLTRATGAMRLCAHCGSPFAEGAEVCPHCASPVTKEEDTMSGVVLEPRRTWVLELVGEVLERALNTGKLQDASRMLSRAAEEFTDRARREGSVDQRALAQISEHALRFAALDGGGSWVRWVVETHTWLQVVPAASLLPAFSKVAGVDETRSLIAQLASALRSMPIAASDEPIIASLERMSQSG